VETKHKHQHQQVLVVLLKRLLWLKLWIYGQQNKCFNTVPSSDHAVPIAVVLVLKLIYTYHTVPLPCCAVNLRSRFQSGIVGARQGKGRFTHSMPCPCRSLAIRAAKGLDCVFPTWFTQFGRVWFTLAMPCPCHALTMPFFSRPQHSTVVERRPVGYLPAFGFFWLPRGVPRRLLSEVCQSQRSIPTSVKSGISTLSEKGRYAAWHVWINARHGRGTAWARRAMCESALSVN
jgi:hypothetical protein